MWKKGGMSWFTAVKRVFMSPTNDNEKLRNKRREENQQDGDDNKRREKRRWIFRKQSSNNHEEEQQFETKTTTNGPKQNGHNHSFDAEAQRHAFAVAAATAAAAQAAAATAQAAVEIIRLTRPTSFAREKYAAIVIQTAFRRYLARRALRALKGIVKLQALIRGHNVRTQTKMMMKCMNSIARLQTQQIQRLGGERCSNFSYDGNRKSMFAETNGLWESKYDLHLNRDRKSLSRDRSSINYGWDDRLHSVEGIKEMLQSKNEATLKREKTMAYANFSNQISRMGSRNKSIGNESELDEKTKWLDRWMATKQWQSSRRAPVTPSPSKVKPVTVRSASPRCMREEKCFSTTHTPKFGSYYFVGGGGSAGAATATMPKYMAATESAKAKVRSQSVPRTRPSTPERERGGGSASAKKRLSFAEPQNIISVGSNSISQNLRSPSFKSMEQQSNMYSYYTDSIGSEISPCSTTDLRRWLR